MFSVIAILEHFLLLEALKDSKIPYLFLIDSINVELIVLKKMPCYLNFCIKKMNQLSYHWKIIFLRLGKHWRKMELPRMNYSSF